MEMRKIVRKIARLTLTKQDYLGLAVDSNFADADNKAWFEGYLGYYNKSNNLHKFEKALVYAKTDTNHANLCLKPIFENLLKSGKWDEIYPLIDACNSYQFSLSDTILQMLNKQLPKNGKDEFEAEQGFKPTEIRAAITQNCDKQIKLKKYEEAIEDSEYYSAYTYLEFAGEVTKDRIKNLITDFISKLDSNHKFKKDFNLLFFILELGAEYDIDIPKEIVECAKVELWRFNPTGPSRFFYDLIIANYENDKHKAKQILEKTINDMKNEK